MSGDFGEHVPVKLKTVFILLGAPLLSGIVASEEAAAQSLQGELNACLWVREEAARLRCFEEVTRRYSVPSPATPESAAIPAAPRENPVSPAQTLAAPEARDVGEKPAALSEDRFGLSSRREPSQEITHREMVIAEARRAPRGEWVLVMNNGQTWRQTDRSPTPEIKSGMLAEIEEGFLGSFKMKVGSLTFRVKRQE